MVIILLNTRFSFKHQSRLGLCEMFTLNFYDAEEVKEFLEGLFRDEAIDFKDYHNSTITVIFEYFEGPSYEELDFYLKNTQASLENLTEEPWDNFESISIVRVVAPNGNDISHSVISHGKIQLIFIILPFFSPLLDFLLFGIDSFKIELSSINAKDGTYFKCKHQEALSRFVRVMSAELMNTNHEEMIQRICSYFNSRTEDENYYKFNVEDKLTTKTTCSNVS